MSNFLLVLIGISLLGFIAGLAGKARAVNKGFVRRSEFYNRLTTISLILMFVFVILYKLLS